MLLPALCWFLAVNLLTLFIFRSDKRRAIEHRRRIPEAHLLRLALAGGSPAALLARRLFRHKTRKQPFSTYLLLIVAVQIGITIGLLIWTIRRSPG
jgi:uncharacterized membrane protein YsdA (DUF1294 family)